MFSCVYSGTCVLPLWYVTELVVHQELGKMTTKFTVQESQGSLTTCWTVLVLGLSWVSCRTRRCTPTWPAAFLPASWMHGTLPPASTSALSPLDKKAEIDILAAEYISTVKTLSSEQRVAHLQKIQSAYSKCKEYSDDKVQLAMQTYEMVSGGSACRLPPLPSRPQEEKGLWKRVSRVGVWSTQREDTLEVFHWACSYDFVFFGVLFSLLVGETIFCLFVFSRGAGESNPGPCTFQANAEPLSCIQPLFFCEVTCSSVLSQVDKHIRRLDADLARFEADLKDRMDGSDFESTGSRSLKSKLTNVLSVNDCSFKGFDLNVLVT